MTRRAPAPPDTLLKLIRRFVPPDEWPRVEATFELARRLRQGERGNDEPVNATGLLLDIVEAAQRELLVTAKVINEEPPPPKPSQDPGEKIQEIGWKRRRS